jgi:hypothetical protein
MEEAKWNEKVQVLGFRLGESANEFRLRSELSAYSKRRSMDSGRTRPSRCGLTVMWGSDYPHTDGVLPDSQEYIQRQFGDLPAATRRKITCENAGTFYGLIAA